MMAVLLVSPERYWLGGILIMLSNAAFGVSTMLSYAYLPVLLARLPDILDRSEPGYNQCGFGVWKRLGSVVEGSRRSEVTRQRSDELSNAAFGVGYIAGVLCLFLCTPFVIFATSMQATWDAQASILGFQLSMAITGLWWLAFYHSPYKHLHPRPGPPVARRGATWERALKEVVADMRKEPMTLSYLLLWFMFSDGVFVISSVASLFANSEVNWGCFPKSVGLLLIAVNAAVGAGIGSLLATRVQRCVGASTKTMLLGSLAVALTVPIYGLLGLFSDDLGFHEGWELLVFAGIYGLAIGPMQGFSRTLYGLLLPPGRESLYFALYQVTDKGSAMIGPLFISWVTQVTGSMRLSFIYSVFFIIVPGVILMRLDVEKGHRDRLASPAEAATDMEESAMENAPVVAT